MTPAGESLERSWDEQLAFFEGENGASLFGVFTVPSYRLPDRAALILSGGGYIGSINRNGLSTRICREFASAGQSAFRFDWHGVGDSTGWVSRFELDRPFVSDFTGAASWVRSQGVREFTIVGSCFGARTALAGAELIEGVQRLVLISLSLGTTATAAGARLADKRSLFEEARRTLRPAVFKKILRRDWWRAALGFVMAKMGLISATGSRSDGWGVNVTRPRLNPDVLTALRGAAAAHISVLLLYGEEDDEYCEFKEAQDQGWLDDILSLEKLQVQVLPGRVHQPVRIEAQNAVLHSVMGWTLQPHGGEK